VGSSAGEWTALKTPSDSDLLAEAMCDVAQACPEVEIVYRAHPFSEHPHLEGSGALARLATLFHCVPSGNIRLSEHSIDQARRFINTGLLAIPPISFAADISDADLVVGEHSIGMVDAARRRIPFVSMNVTRRRDLFSAFTTLGFPHCVNSQQLAHLIEEISLSGTFSDKYNNAVERFNGMLRAKPQKPMS
jgi:hypothetical protein